jgi:hypothetical protein
MMKIDTVSLLKEVHSALQEVQQTGDQELLAAAESVLSALIVVIRHERAEVPDQLGPYIVKLIRRRR